jgi:hypothetical protein
MEAMSNFSLKSSSFSCHGLTTPAVFVVSLLYKSLNGALDRVLLVDPDLKAYERFAAPDTNIAEPAIV